MPTPRRAASPVRTATGLRGRRPPTRFGRWWRVALLVTAVMLGLPLAHALFGEVGALLGAAVVFGFLLGRWTAPGR